MICRFLYQLRFDGLGHDEFDQKFWWTVHHCEVGFPGLDHLMAGPEDSRFDGWAERYRYIPQWMEFVIVPGNTRQGWISEL